MRDFFSVFYEAHRVYEKLCDTMPEVDVSVEGLDNEGKDLSIQVKTSGEPSSAPVVMNTSSPLCYFKTLPQEIRGDYEEVVTALKNFTDKLTQELKRVSLYKQFGKAVRKNLVESNKILNLLEFFLKVLDRYGDRKDRKKDINIKVKTCYPANISLYSQKNNVSLVYDFCTNSISLTGFKNPETIDYKKFLKYLNFTFEKIIVDHKLLSERVSRSYIRLPEYKAVVDLNENSFDLYQSTTDEMMDNVIQSLIYIDALDTLQDVIMDTDELYLFFDPYLKQNDVEDVLINNLKNSFPVANIVATPHGSDSDYWVVQIAKEQPAINDFSQGEEINYPGNVPDPVHPGDPGVMAKPSKQAAQEIGKDIDVEAAIDAL